MSNAPSEKFDPTESVRTLTSKMFKESGMTLREHQDTDKHYIGDSLPVPSPSMVASSGVNSSVGVQAFPARADHAHELKTVWTWINSGALTVPPGSVFINNLSHTGWGRNMLVSGQVAAFPFPGLYIIQANLAVTRDAGGLFTNEMNILFYYNNGGSGKYILRQSNFDLPTPMYINVTDYAINTTAPSTNDNIQVCVQHNDSSNWTVSLQQLMIVRMSSPTSN